jgi:hypothetical protein
MLWKISKSHLDFCAEKEEGVQKKGSTLNERCAPQKNVGIKKWSDILKTHNVLYILKEKSLL